MELSEIRKVIEIDVYGGETPWLINEALQDGWSILSLSQRRPVGDEVHWSRYILGHTDVNAIDPVAREAKRSVKRLGDDD